MEALAIAAKLIQEFEGCKLKAYQDQKGVWTIGWGSTGEGLHGAPGPGVTWTQAEADQRFKADLGRFYDRVSALIREPLSPAQMAAAVSFAYNVGIHNFERSGFRRFVNTGEFQKAAENLLLWNRVGLYVSRGLTFRREREARIFLGEETLSPPQA